MLKPGDRFGDYTVERLLGRGGMGAVFLLENAEGAQVAAKILDPAEAGDHESRRRFLREAELALGVRHPNLVGTHDVGEDPDTGLCYILMEYVPGGSLADYLKEHGALPVEDAVAVVQAMASVLELARQRGIVHRDIKPANIMFDAEGTPKLADLGIARGGIAGTETTTVTQTGMMIGTPAYMAPEQMLDAHHVDIRADIYSLGVVFFEMLTGERPNKDDTVVQLMARAVKGEPLPDVRTLRPEVSASLAQLLNMMVAPDRDGRISTPGQITSALDIIARGGTFAAKPAAIVDGRARTPAAPQTNRDSKSLPWKTLIPIGLLAGLAAAFGIFAPKREKVVQSVVTTNVVERLVEKTNVVRTVAHAEDDARVETAVRTKDGVCRWKGPEGEWTYCVRNGLASIGDGKGCALYPRPTGRLTIPATIRGLPVEGIAHGAFQDCRELTAVTLSEGILEIDRDVFKNCSSLAEVTLPKSMRRFGRWNFFGTPIRSLNLGRIDYWDGRIIGGMTNLVELKFDSLNDRFICEDGMVLSRDKTRLLFSPRCDEKLKLPQNVSTLDVWSISNPKVLVPKQIACVEPLAFANCHALRSVRFESPRASIGHHAFHYAINLCRVELPEGLLEISSSKVFSSCSSLQEIRFPASIRKLGAELLSNCTSLRRVAFDGNAPELVDDGRQFRGADIFRGTPRDLVVFVKRGSKGWNPNGEGLPKCWPVGAGGNARTIRYADEDVGPDVEKRTFDPEKLKDPDSTRAVQKALDALFPGWKVSAVEQPGEGAGWAAGYQSSWRGEKDVVATMPPNMETPTVISRRVAAGKSHPVLNLEVASQNVDVDFLLSVRVNGKTALEPRLICTPEDSPYARIQVPLSAYRGRKVLVEIVHAANNWFYEHAFWRKIEIVEGTGRESAGIVGVRRMEVFPAANPDNVKWLRRTPWRYTEKAPGDSWKTPSFDDSRWRKSARAFGRDAGSRMSVAERWQGERIWLRRSFSWDASKPVYNAVFSLCFDQDVEIFLNGTPVLKRDGRNTGWDLHAADRTAFAGALRQGENVLAVTLNGDGPSFFDCGLVVETLDRELQDARGSRQEKGPRYTEEGLLEEPVFDAARFADRDSTRRVQKTLDALFPGWKTTKNAEKAVHPNEEIGYISDICGRQDVLATLPPSRQSPVRLTCSIAVPANAKLSFAVRKNPTDDGGLMLEVYANGKRRWEGMVTDGEWFEHAVDLSDLAGKKARLEVRHMIHPDFGNARALWSDLAVR